MQRGRLLALVTNALLVALEIAALLPFFLRDGLAMFRYYTECSNTLAAVAGLACLSCGLRKDGGATGTATHVAHRLKFVACCIQLVTLVVVALVLAPMISAAGGNGPYEMFLAGGRPVTHLLGPVLTLLSYLAFETQPLPTRRDSMLALGATFVYATIAYALNFARVLEGPYPFFQVWDMPIWQSVAWFCVLFAVAWSLAQVPRIAAHKLSERRQAC